MFFGAMFITMECLARMGLITWIGKQTEELILMVEEEYRLGLAIIIVLWVSHCSIISMNLGNYSIRKPVFVHKTKTFFPYQEHFL